MVVKHSLAFAVIFFVALAVVFANSDQIHAQQDQGSQDQTGKDEAAQFAAGVAAYHAEDFQKAYASWAPLAESGDNAAQYNIGILYQYGLGVPQDVSEAVKWYMKSAEAGFADASMHLGDLYASGFFGEPDDTAALIWYEKAEKQGHIGAETKLAATRARLIPQIPAGSQGSVSSQ